MTFHKKLQDFILKIKKHENIFSSLQWTFIAMNLVKSLRFLISSKNQISSYQIITIGK